MNPQGKIRTIVGQFTGLIADLEAAIAACHKKKDANYTRITMLEARNISFDESVLTARNTITGLNNLVNGSTHFGQEEPDPSGDDAL